MHYAFDLDGTLFDTKEAVRQSYIVAGVVPPDDFFGKTFLEWYEGDDPDKVHITKNRAYANSMGLIKPLPLLEVYRKLGNPLILTGASEEAAKTVLSYFEIQPGALWCDLSLDQKIEIMNGMGEGIMFDDSPIAAVTMRALTRWTVCCTF